MMEEKGSWNSGSDVSKGESSGPLDLWMGELPGARSHKALKDGSRRLNCILAAMGRHERVLCRGVI